MGITQAAPPAGREGPGRPPRDSVRSGGVKWLARLGGHGSRALRRDGDHVVARGHGGQVRHAFNTADANAARSAVALRRPERRRSGGSPPAIARLGAVPAPHGPESVEPPDRPGFWSLLRSWLRPHRGISQEKLPVHLVAGHRIGAGGAGASTRVDPGRRRAMNRRSPISRTMREADIRLGDLRQDLSPTMSRPPTPPRAAC